RQTLLDLYRCQATSILKWVCRVVPASVRSSRCLPRAATSRTTWPLRSAVAKRGTRKSVAPSRSPARAVCMRLAARKTVSPSGIGGLAAQPEAAGGGPEPGLGQGPGQGGVGNGRPRGLLDPQPAQGAVADGQGEGVGRPAQPLLVVGEGEQGAAAAVHAHDQGCV